MAEEVWFTEWEEMSERPEIRFLGIVIDVKYPCRCRYCEKGKEALEEMGGRRSQHQLHIVIAPLNNFTKLQHAYITMDSRSRVSRKGVWIHAMTRLGIPYKTRTELETFLKNTVIEFRKMTVGDYMVEYVGYKPETLKQFGNVQNAQVLFPDRIIPKDALELYDLNEKEVEKRVKVFSEAWNRLLEGESEEEVYQWVIEQLTQELEEMLVDETVTEETTEETTEENSKNKRRKRKK